MSEPEDPSRAKVDAYANRYMSGPHGALYHDKIVAPWWFHLLLLVPILVMIVTVFLPGGKPTALLGMIPVALVWLLFSVLRVSVSEDELFIQYGLFGPRIPIADVVSCEAVEYDWKKYGGWGIRFGVDGSVAYNMMGDRGRAVRIVYRKGTRTKTVLVASPDPERLALAVQQARVLSASRAYADGDPKLRVAERGVDDARPGAEIEAEERDAAEAESTDERSRREER
jgi:hypothetical protein